MNRTIENNAWKCTTHGHCMKHNDLYYYYHCDTLAYFL